MKSLEQAVVKAALDLFGETSSAAFKVPVPNTAPPLFVLCGEEQQLASLLSSQNVGAGEVVRVIEAAQALAPLLDEGWDEYDAPEDQNAGAKACDELVAAVAAMLAKDRT